MWSWWHKVTRNEHIIEVPFDFRYYNAKKETSVTSVPLLFFLKISVGEGANNLGMVVQKHKMGTKNYEFVTFSNMGK